MKHHLMLTIASLLSILFMTFHLMDDITRGMEPGTLSDLIAVPILVVPVIHMKAVGVGGAIANQRSLLLYLDTPRARRDRPLLRHPLGARTVEAFAMAHRRSAQQASVNTQKRPCKIT